MQHSFRYSIIIPHYNIPDLLMRCLRSIPVRDDIQVIVVDDCSPGAEQYKVLYPELSRPYLELYSTEKGGNAGRARNVGLSHAKGKWLVFADADDFFVDGAAALFDAYKDATEDIIYFKHLNVDTDDFSKKGNRCQVFNETIGQMGRNPEAETKLRCSHNTPWAKFIRRDFIEEHHIRYEEIRYSNDSYFNVKAGCEAQSIRAVDRVLYVLTERSGSLTSGNNKTIDELYIRTKAALKVEALIKSYSYNYQYNASTWLVPQLYQRDLPKFRECIRICRSYKISIMDIFKAIGYQKPKSELLKLLYQFMLAYLNI